MLDKQKVMKHLCLVLSLMVSLSMVNTPVFSSPCLEVKHIASSGDPEFGYVNIFPEGFRIVIEWEFTSKIKTKYFVVQRQTAEQEFENVSGINVKGEDPKRQMFTMDDTNFELGSTVRYRIKAVLEDGSVHYSDILQIGLPDEGYIKIYPNPVKEYVNLEYVLPFLTNYQVHLFDLMGNTILEEKIAQPVNLMVKERMNMNNLRPGLYFIQVTVGKETFTQRVIKT